MNIHLMQGENGYELLNEEGQQVGKILWQLEDQVMLMNGTIINPELRGQNAGEQLLNASAQYARDNGYKMRAICPYVVKKFMMSDAYNDVKEF